jgi:aminopeptidase-like protein
MTVAERVITTAGKGATPSGGTPASAGTGASAGAAGREMYDLVADLYPICRSITGDGVRQTLRTLGRHIPLTVFEVPTGTQVFDWTIPREWNITDAYIKNSRGERIVDFDRCNLHVLNYSVPVHATMPLAELRPHLSSIPEHPTWIPYRTSYYKEAWGFCVSHEQLLALEEDHYEVCIDSSLTDGQLTYGECYLPGATTDEILISCHICHPSLCNDNLSGVSVATFLAGELAKRPRRYSYRFLFIPGTIGAIAWLARNQAAASRVKHGLVLTCVGDAGGFHYKKSRRGDADIDRAMAHVLRQGQTPHDILDFSPYGYDERQFCSPGFNLPVGCLMRSVWGEFPQYHTSADDLSFVQPAALAESLRVCLAAMDLLEHNRVYRNTNPCCEPALGRRGLYRTTGGEGIGNENLARLWVLNLSDGDHTLLDIAERSGMSFTLIRDAATELADHGLLVEAGADARPVS